MSELTFKGKEFVFNHHLAVPHRPLLPDPAKSVGEARLDGNMIIHGDNLHALKSLLPLYAGRIDLVLIDPPYNTGNEGWSYNDNVNSPMMQEWLRSNPIGIDDRLRHDKWCAMMWPRLRLLKELLSPSGVFAVCIDENELHRLHSACDEIFGEDQYLGSIVWRTRNVDNRVKTRLSVDHEYVLLYSGASRVQGRTIDRSDFQNTDDDPRGPYTTDPLTGKAKADRRKNLHYTIENEETGDKYPPDPDLGWITDEEGFKALLKDKRIAWPSNPRTGKPRKKRFLSETAERMPESTFWSDFKGVSGYDDLDRMFGERPFDFPKPLEMIERVIDLCAPSDALILDSFAGSGTTAHAVLKANAKDGGTRRFILVEGENYADSLTAERVRRAINGYEWQGSHRETLLEERVTLTQLKKADQLLAKVDAIRAREGLTQGDLADQGESKTPRFDSIEAKVDDGVLRVEGVANVSERVPGLGGTFTFCSLGPAVELDRLLTGADLPTFEQLGTLLFHTATNEPCEPANMFVKDGHGYLGESTAFHVWLIYKPDLDFLKSRDAALTMAKAQAIAEVKPGKRHLVFAPAKFVSQKLLDEANVPVEFAPLPWALYRTERA
jgi:adenine-specific DNA-methyltransferase